MDVVLITIGSAGDVHPFLALGRGLTARGHRVTLATNAYFEDIVRNGGLDFAAVGERREFVENLNDEDIWHPRRGIRLLVEKAIVPALPLIYRLVEARAVNGTVFAASILAAGARVAQEKLGVPLATVHLSPYSLLSFEEPPLSPLFNLPSWLPRRLSKSIWSSLDLVSDRIMGAPVNAFRSELGLPPARHVLTRWINSPRKVIALFPDWFARPAPDWPAVLEHTGFITYDRKEAPYPKEELQRFLSAGTPPVLFTPGSANAFGKKFFAAAAEACRSSGRRGLFLTPYRDQLPPRLPGGVRHFDYLPFGDILPQCTAIVHHGGIGTVGQGLAAGIPQVVTPFNFDQPDNGSRLQKLGAGRSLRPRDFHGVRLSEALDEVLASEECRARCRVLASRVAPGPSLESACRAVEALVEPPPERA